MGKWMEMYFEKDTETGMYWIHRIDSTGYVNTAPFQFKSKTAACQYIKSHDLKPKEWRK